MSITTASDAPPRTSARSLTALTVLRERPEIALSILLFILCMGAWQFATVYFEIPSLILPSPSAILASLADAMSTPSFYRHLGLTFYEIMAGFALGALAGFSLGALVGQFALLEKTLYPYIVAFQAVPKVAVAPIVIIWFGYESFSKVVLTGMVAFFPILANTIAGLRATPPEQIELMLVYTASPWQVFWKAKLRNALPYVVVGIDIALMMSVVGAIIGEFVGAKAGLGYLILQRQFSMDMPGVFAILIVLSLIGVVLHLAVRALRRRYLFWINTEDATGSF